MIATEIIMHLSLELCFLATLLFIYFHLTSYATIKKQSAVAVMIYLCFNIYI